jgi:hypothetical protein
MHRSEIFRSFPYLVHTNRELGLMLKGVKPLAYFSDFPETMPDCTARYLRMFDRHVKQGRFTKHLHIEHMPAEKLPHKEFHKIFYTLPGEEWRVDAMLELYASPKPWSDTHERRLGELYGYEDWQNDWWLARHSRDECI